MFLASENYTLAPPTTGTWRKRDGVSVVESPAPKLQRARRSRGGLVKM